MRVTKPVGCLLVGCGCLVVVVTAALVLGIAFRGFLPFFGGRESPRALLSAEVQPAREARRYAVASGVAVTIPGGLVRTATRLVVSDDPAERKSAPAGATAFRAVSVTLGDLHELSQEVVVELPLPRGEGQLVGVRWDEELRGWIVLPAERDAARGTVRVRTDHLTPVGAAMILGVAIYAVLDQVVGPAADWAAHQSIYDHHDSPLGHFQIRYVRKILNGPSSAVRDELWTGTDDARAAQGHPRFVLDLALALEKAWGAYVGANLPPPPTPVVIKVQSAAMPQDVGAAAWDSNADRLHVRTEKRRPGDDLPYDLRARVSPDGRPLDPFASALALLRRRTAHELMHAFQGVSYDPERMAKNGGESADHLWWVEAEAEYGANVLAWQQDLIGDGPRQIDQRLLAADLTRTGPSGRSGEREYDLGHFVDFVFTRLNVSFLPLHKAAAARDTAIEAVRAHVEAAGTPWPKACAGFAAWFYLGQDSPTRVWRNGNPAGCCGPLSEERPLAAGQAFDPVDLHVPRAGEALGTDCSALPYSVHFGGDASRTLVLEVPRLRGGRARVDAYLRPSGVRDSAPVPVPSASFESEGQSARVQARPGTTLHLVVSNAGLAGATARVVLRDPGARLRVEPARVDDSSGRTTFRFTARLEGAPAGAPLRVRWSFDGGPPGEQAWTGPDLVQEHTFPGPGDWRAVASVVDASFPGLESEVTVPVHLGRAPGGSPPKAAEAKTAPDTGVWVFDGEKSGHSAPVKAPDTETIAITSRGVAGSVFHNPPGDAAWTSAFDCTWTWTAPGDMQTLVPGQKLSVKLVLTDSGNWANSNSGAYIRLDKPDLGTTTSDAGAVDLVAIGVARKGKGKDEAAATPTIPGAPPPSWGGRMGLKAACWAAYGNSGWHERTYRWAPNGAAGR